MIERARAMKAEQVGQELAQEVSELFPKSALMQARPASHGDAAKTDADDTQLPDE